MSTHAIRTAGRLLGFLVLLFALSPARAATFAVTYTNANGQGFYDPSVGAARRAAFEAALANWGQHLGASPVAINVTASFDSLGGSSSGATLGQAGPTGFFRDFAATNPRFKAGIFYPSALANHLAGRDLDPAKAEINAQFNSDVGSPGVLGGQQFYYGTDGNPGSGIDFYTIVLHEIGHGLGFTRTLTATGTYGGGTTPDIYDDFLTEGNGAGRVRLSNETPAQRATAVVSDNLFFDGPRTDAANGGAPAKLYAPATFSSGSSVSHLDQATFSGVNLNHLMAPFAGSPIHDAGPVGLGIFHDIGWAIPPFVSSITRLDTSPTSATSVRFSVTFTAPVTGVDATDFALATTGTVAGASVSNVSGSGNAYIVTVSVSGGQGTVKLNLLDDDSIHDSDSVPLGGVGTTDASKGNGSFAAGQSYSLAPVGTLLGVVAVNAGNSRVVNVDTSGAQSVIASSNPPLINSYGVARASDGTLYVSNFSAPSVVKISPSGVPATLTTGTNLLNHPFGIALGPDGQLYVANVGNSAIIKVDPTSGAQSTLTSGGSLSGPRGLTFGSDGQLYVGNDGGHDIVKVNPATGAQSVYTDDVTLLVSGDGFYAGPWGVAFGPDGTLYVADNANGRVVKVASDGASASGVTASGNAALTDPAGLAYGNDGNLYVARGSASSIVRVSTTGTISTLSSGGSLSGTSDVALVSVAPQPSATTGALLSQFRLSGPGGTTDEFIELANTTSSALNVSGWSVVASTTTPVTIPLSGTIPAFGHLLLANSGGYSLGSVAAPDINYTGDFSTGAALAVKNAAGTVVDSVGTRAFLPAATTDQYAYIRRLESGAPSNTGTFATDWNCVNTIATSSTTDSSGVGAFSGARLGSPNPHNAASTIQRNGDITFAPMNIPGVYSAARYASKGSGVDSKGRLSFRRTITNNTGGAVSKLRFRIVGATAGSSTASGVSDLRAISSGGVRYYDANNGNAITRAAYGLAIDAPTTPTETPLTSASSGNGGGLNASWTAPLPGGTLANGASVNVEFLFGIQAEGSFRVVVDTELLP